MNFKLINKKLNFKELTKGFMVFETLKDKFYQGKIGEVIFEFDQDIVPSEEQVVQALAAVRLLEASIVKNQSNDVFKVVHYGSEFKVKISDD